MWPFLSASKSYDPTSFLPLFPLEAAVAEAVEERGKEALKDTFEMLKQAVEAKSREDLERRLAELATEHTWTRWQRGKLKGLREDAQARLEAGGNRQEEQRVTEDLEIVDDETGETLAIVPGTVRDGSLARLPQHRQGPRVRYEASRQVLFELTVGMLKLPIEKAAKAVAANMLLDLA